LSHPQIRFAGLPGAAQSKAERVLGWAKENRVWRGSTSAGKRSEWPVSPVTTVASPETALEVLRACELKLVQRSLQISYDNLGNKYDLPIFVINNPDKFEVQDAESRDFGGKSVSVRFQYLNHFREESILLNTSVSDALKKATAFVISVDPFDPRDFLLLLVYQGKVWKENMKIGTYLAENSVVQIFKAARP